MLQHQNIAIPETLRGYIRQIWMLDSGDREISSRNFSIYADGCPGIIFQQSEWDLRLNQDKKLSSVFLYGQTVEPVTMSTDGRMKMIILCFHPHVVQPIFRFSAKEVTDDCLDLSLLPPV